MFFLKFLSLCTHIYCADPAESLSFCAFDGFFVFSVSAAGDKDPNGAESRASSKQTPS